MGGGIEPRRHGGKQGPGYWAAHQRLVVLTFASVEEAEAWDAAGQPLGGGDGPLFTADVVETEESEQTEIPQP